MRKKRNYSVLWALILLSSFGLLGGCVRSSNDINKENALKLNFQTGDVSSLNPHELALSANGLTVGKCLFEGLTRLSTEGKYELAGAKSVDISPCGTRYLFTLRSNYYSDGTLVVAFDYERSWKQAIAPNSKCGKAHLFYPIKNAEKAKKKRISLEEVGVKALDKKTLLIELDYPAPYFLSLLSSPLFAPFRLKEKDVIGSGPYVASVWEKEENLTLKPNLFFWNKESIRIKEIKISMIKDETTAFCLYEKGEFDWLGDPLSPFPSDVLELQINKRSVKEKTVVRPFWLYINTIHFPLSSPLIRQALSCVIDRNLIAKHIYVGNQPLFTPLPSGLSKCNDPLIDKDFSRGRELFEKGMESLGLTHETFPPITLSCYHLLADKKLAEYLQETWQKAFGIKVRLDVQEWNVFYSNLQNGNFEIGGAFLASDYNDPLSLLERLSCPNNFPRWNHPLFQQLIAQAKKEVDPELRMRLIGKSKEVLETEFPVIWVINQSFYYSHQSRLKGVCCDYAGIPDFRWAYFERPQIENLRFLQNQ